MDKTRNEVGVDVIVPSVVVPAVGLVVLVIIITTCIIIIVKKAGHPSTTDEIDMGAEVCGMI